MIATLLSRHFFVSPGTAARANGAAVARPIGRALFPRSRAIRNSAIECRWQIDPETGALTARWALPSAHARAANRHEPRSKAPSHTDDRLRGAARGTTARSHTAASAAA